LSRPRSLRADRRSKFRRDRRVPVILPEQMGLLCHALRRADGEGDALFRPWGNVCRDLHEPCRRAGIAPGSPNDLRRTFGTWLRQRGVQPALIGVAWGDADSRTVERVYGRLPTEDLRRQLIEATGTRVSVPEGVYHRCIKRPLIPCTR
jgi:integrase